MLISQLFVFFSVYGPITAELSHQHDGMSHVIINEEQKGMSSIKLGRFCFYHKTLNRNTSCLCSLLSDFNTCLMAYLINPRWQFTYCAEVCLFGIKGPWNELCEHFLCIHVCNTPETGQVQLNQVFFLERVEDVLESICVHCRTEFAQFLGLW